MSEKVFNIDGREIVVGIDDGECGPDVGIWDHETAELDLTDEYIEHPEVVAWLDEELPQDDSVLWPLDLETYSEQEWEARRNGDRSEQ